MRTLIQVEFDTETANRLIADGTMPKALQGIMASLKPEAAYFAPTAGRRCAYLFVDLPNEYSLVPMLEPLWELNAEISITPCMNADDLAKGLGIISGS
ncbi:MULTISPECIES: hypothetical protein [unclassified Kitasatospora]|uniref:hypothetical protein n=1 Tax=unclassified Kitasatospora TaxID=2633591 RepID=UPI00070E5A12|nr:MULTISPECIES: hypothetical protein [unclassified Kitasatospora]KQV04663.1 hypothetical protein ASC99_14860 [Kitasatospora sp. Root107]KRB60811.1 hypothetical protein ASE03_10655 [Kitasatospora sp. Root187]